MPAYAGMTVKSLTQNAPGTAIKSCVPCASVLTELYGRSAPMLGNARYLTIPDTFWVRL